MDSEEVYNEQTDVVVKVNYSRRQSVYAGIILVVAGSVSIVSDVTAVALLALPNSKDTYSHMFDRNCVGIWSGVLCVVAGYFGVSASKHGNAHKITAFVVFSSTASIVCLLYQFYYSVQGALNLFNSQYIGENCLSLSQKNIMYGLHSKEAKMTCVKAQLLFANDVILTVTAFVGGMTGIWGSVICGKYIFCTAIVNEFNGVINRYSRRQSMFCGSLLILAGLLSITFNSVAINVRLSMNEIRGMELIGHGIWSGTICILAGIIGIATGIRENERQVTAFAIFSSAATIVCLLYQLNDGMVGAQFEEYKIRSDVCQPEPSSDSTVSEQPQRDCRVKERTILVLDALVATTAIFGGMAGIWGTVICCQVVCCNTLTYISQQLTSTTRLANLRTEL